MSGSLNRSCERAKRNPVVCADAALVCPVCFTHCPAVAEVTFVVECVWEAGPLWVCPACFARLDVEVIGLELTGRILGDARAFGRRNR